MESGDVQSLTFWAQRAGSLTIRSLDSVTRQSIPNVEFKVTYADGRPVDTPNGQQSSNGQYFTDANGEIRITGVIGTIIVTEEKAADNYTMDSANRSQTVIVRPADGQRLTFFDTPAQGLTVQLYVKGTTEPIPGAKFLLTDGTGAKLGDENGEFTTDENGRFSLSGLKPGLTVKVKQISTQDSYILDGTPKTVTIKPDSEQTVTVYNAPKQTLTVRLYVKGTETPIPGAKFRLRDSGGALVGENNGVFTTDNNGEFTITGLTPGVTITATQTETVSGYVLNETPQSILIRSGNAQSLAFYNAPKGALVVKKLDAVTEEPLAGAEFKILTISGTPVDDNEGKTSTKGVYKTDDNGEITLLKLEPGVYTVTETKAPSGYVLDSEPQTVTVNADDRQTLTFRDNPLQSLTITKYEDGTTKPLAGVTFMITDANGNRVGNGEYVTDANGQITITGLAPGTTVIAREVRTVKGYVLNGNPQTITIGNGANALTSGASAGNGTATGNALTFYDEPLTTLVIRKFIEGTDNEPLANVEFKITDGRGAKVGNGTYYTDKSGEIRVENLEPGMTVTVRETKTVSGYVLDGTPKTAEIPSGDVLEMDFWNSRQGALVVRKQDAETKAPLGGVEFKITYADGRPVDTANGQVSSAGQYFTDDNGEIRISGITGTLIVTEEKSAPGYVIDPNAKTKTVTVNPGDTQTLTFFNQKKQTLTVQKFVEGTKTPIPGVTFLITDSAGTVVGADNGEFVTDDNGRIVISDLTPGVTITAKETRAADGYALNATPKSIAIKSGAAQTLTFYNAPLRSLVVHKYVKGTTKPIPGVTFQVTDADGVPIGNGEYVTDDNGQIVIPNLAPGVTVSVREVKSASGFVLNGTPQTVKIKATGNNALTFYDEPLSALVVHKYEEGTDNKPLSGVEFRITDGNGAAVGNGTFYTDKNGEIRVENLEPGMTVTVRETKTLSGYVLDGTPQTVKISGDAKEVVFWNAPQQTLTINKFVDGTTTPIKGVTFGVFPNERKK